MADHELRKIFKRHMKKHVKVDRVALLLSSGLDSTIVGVVAHELGITVESYTFHLEGVYSFDAKHAAETARRMGWKHTEVVVPSDVSEVAAKWPILNKKYKCRKKRDYECTYPMLYCYKQIKKDKHTHVLNGLVADAYFCFARNTHIAKISGPHSKKPDFDRYRMEYWKEWFATGVEGLTPTNNPSAMLQHELLADKYNLKTVNPFLDKATYDYFMRFSWQELNKPKQKMPLREAWPEYIELLGHRNHRGYQTDARIPQLFEKLLDDPKINVNGRKRIMDVARDWAH